MAAVSGPERGTVEPTLQDLLSARVGQGLVQISEEAVGCDGGGGGGLRGLASEVPERGDDLEAVLCHLVNDFHTKLREELLGVAGRPPGRSVRHHLSTSSAANKCSFGGMLAQQQHVAVPMHVQGSASDGTVFTLPSVVGRLHSSVRKLEVERFKSAMKRNRKSSGSDGSGGSSGAWLPRVVHDPIFELFFGFCIMVNAVLVGVEADLSAENPIEMDDLGFFFYSTLFFTLLFITETACRVAASGRAFFASKALLNWFDVCLVLLSVADLVFVAIGDSSLGGTVLRLLRIVRITRLVKVLRIGRIVRFVRALRKLVQQVAATLRSLFWVLVLMLMFFFLFGLVFCEAATAHRRSILLGDVDGAISPGIELYWSSLPRCIFTLFLSVFGGISWRECVLPLADFGSWCVALFVFFICFFQLAVMNVVTGVFCQSAIESAEKDTELFLQAALEERERYADILEEIFHRIMVSEGTSISMGDFKDRLNDERFKSCLYALGIDTSDVWTLFSLLDSSSAAVLTVEDFVTGCLRMKGAAKGYDIAKVNYEQKLMFASMRSQLEQTRAATETLAKQVVATEHRLSAQLARSAAPHGDGEAPVEFRC